MKQYLILFFSCYSLFSVAQEYSFVPDSLSPISQEELFKKPPPRNIDLVYFEDGTQSSWTAVFPKLVSQELLPKMYVNSKGEYKLLVVIENPELKAEKEMELPYEAKMADLGEIQLEYFDYGGDGHVLLILQDFHNYYSGPMKKRLNDPYFSFAKGLSKEFRVIAPLRRGYGNSSASEWGYDVATLSTDIIDFLDALKIDKAFLYARVPANQELTWLAEYYPDRLHGLIYEGRPVLTVNCMDPEVLEFSNNIQLFAMDGFDRDKARQVYLSRSMWRPRFLKDTSLRLDVPAILFSMPKQEVSTPNLSFGARERIQMTISMPMEDREEEKEYLNDLLLDSSRYERLYEKLQDCNQGEEVQKAMERAFGNNLSLFIQPDEFYEQTMEAYQGFKDWQLEAVVEFKKKVMD